MITLDAKVAVQVATTELIEFMDARAKEYFAEHYPNLAPATHYTDGGRKYVRIVQDNGGRHVHCFVDVQTGSVYKAAGWKTPALNGERFNILDRESFAELKRVWDPHGAYLYKK